MRPRTSIVGKLIAFGALLSLAPTAAEAMSVQELAQHTHFHGLAVDPADSSQLLLATHHGLFSVAQDGSVGGTEPSFPRMSGEAPDGGADEQLERHERGDGISRKPEPWHWPERPETQWRSRAHANAPEVQRRS